MTAINIAIQRSRLWIIGLLLLSSVMSTHSATGEEHPFILWTRQEAAATRRKIERETWVKEAYAALEIPRKRRGELEQQRSQMLIVDLRDRSDELRVLRLVIFGCDGCVRFRSLRRAFHRDVHLASSCSYFSNERRMRLVRQNSVIFPRDYLSMA